jgi:tetratricopeptide (TPR) repeat protein
VHRALATECIYSGRPLSEAIAHGRDAVALLERTDDRLWLSQALFTLSYCCTFAGEFEPALVAAGRLEAFGDASGMRRAQANALMLMALSRATRGEGAAGIELCERARALSPDLFETAYILALLGKSRLEAGDASGAVADLEEAVRLADQVRSFQFRLWFRTMLGEAYVYAGEFDKAADVTGYAFEKSRGIQFALGTGLAKQVLGRVAHARGDHTRAEIELTQAAKMLESIGASFELARTSLELARTTLALGQTEKAAAHLDEARRMFAGLGATEYVARAERLSRQH